MKITVNPINKALIAVMPILMTSLFHVKRFHSLIKFRCIQFLLI